MVMARRMPLDLTLMALAATSMQTWYEPRAGAGRPGREKTDSCQWAQ